jgi:hypothetical protein
MTRDPGWKPAKEEGSMRLFLGCDSTSSKPTMAGMEEGGSGIGIVGKRLFCSIRPHHPPSEIGFSSSILFCPGTDARGGGRLLY